VASESARGMNATLARAGGGTAEWSQRHSSITGPNPSTRQPTSWPAMPATRERWPGARACCRCFSRGRPGPPTWSTCRGVRTFRRECLDHLILLNQDQLLTILNEFVADYNRDRPHRSLGL